MVDDDELAYYDEDCDCLECIRIGMELHRENDDGSIPATDPAATVGNDREER